jgi:YidC/Oxa1 family membrane protein insertase
MEKRVIVFLILSLAIIIGYDYVLKQTGIISPPAESDQLPASDSSATKLQESAAPTADKKASTETARTLTTTSASASPMVQAQTASEEQIQEVTTDLFRALFTNHGAVLTSWQLTRYASISKEKSEPIQMVYQGGKFRKPLSLQAMDAALTTQINEGLYEVQRDFSTLDTAHPTGHLTFTYSDTRSGLRVVKELTFHHDTYVVDIAVRTEGLSGPVDVVLGTNFGIIEWGEGFIGLIGPATKVDDQIAKDAPDAEVQRNGSVGWVALQDKYFLGVLIPTGASSAVIKKEGEKLFSAAVRYAASPNSTAASMALYAGPKEFDTLKSFNIGLEDTIDFGWFIYGSWGIVKAVAKPLFSVLRFINDYTHNYGVAIILLTVSIKLLFVPLQYKSYKSMKDMQLVQPKVAGLQAKYKDDRERLNKELIKLYRDHKVNPVGGCLPMVLQMPVFVALFNILYMTIDLRQAPFFLWISDLSAQDPYYVLPIIMGISMVIQQKIMPTTMDPTQAKIMLLLPAFMTLLFLSFPAGLVLYWLTNNVITITQQFVTDRYIFKKRTLPSSSEPALTSSSEDGQKSSNKKKKTESATKQPVSANLDQPDA